jgi:hypothetical protein
MREGERAIGRRFTGKAGGEIPAMREKLMRSDARLDLA